MPRPGTPVVHRRFEERNRPAATGTMTGTCTIRRAGTGEGTYNPVTGVTTPPDPTVVYTGPCRIQPRPTAQRVVDFGGQPTTLRAYAVSLPWDSDQVEIDDVVTVDSASDPLLDGRELTVLDVSYSSLHWQRDLVCQDSLGPGSA